MAFPTSELRRDDYSARLPISVTVFDVSVLSWAPNSPISASSPIPQPSQDPLNSASLSGKLHKSCTYKNREDPNLVVSEKPTPPLTKFVLRKV